MQQEIPDMRGISKICIVLLALLILVITGCHAGVAVDPDRSHDTTQTGLPR